MPEGKNSFEHKLSVAGTGEYRDFSAFKKAVIDAYNKAAANKSESKGGGSTYLVPVNAESVAAPDCRFTSLETAEIFGNDFIEKFKADHEAEKARCLIKIDTADASEDIIDFIQNSIHQLELWVFAWEKLYSHNNEITLPAEIDEIKSVVNELVKYRQEAANNSLEEKSMQFGVGPSFDDVTKVVKSFFKGQKKQTAEQLLVVPPFHITKMVGDIKRIMTRAYEKYAKPAGIYHAAVAELEKKFAQIPEKQGGGSEVHILLNENAANIADQFATDLQSIIARSEAELLGATVHVKNKEQFLN